MVSVAQRKKDNEKQTRQTDKEKHGHTVTDRQIATTNTKRQQKQNEVLSNFQCKLTIYKHRQYFLDVLYLWSLMVSLASRKLSAALRLHNMPISRSLENILFFASETDRQRYNNSGI